MMVRKMQETDTENEVNVHDCDDHGHVAVVVVVDDDDIISHDGQDDARD